MGALGACLALFFGRILTADGEPAAGLRVVVDWSHGSFATLTSDTLVRDRTGRFAIPARGCNSDSVAVSIVAAAGARYYPTRISIARSRLADVLEDRVLARHHT